MVNNAHTETRVHVDLSQYFFFPCCCISTPQRQFSVSTIMEAVVSSAPFIAPIDSFEHCQIFLFGDLASPFEDDLAQLLHCKNNALLQSFFDQVNRAYRTEFATLPAEQQEWLPRFTDLVDLVSNLNSTIGARALRFGLLCVYQLGRLIQ